MCGYVYSHDVLASLRDGKRTVTVVKTTDSGSSSSSSIVDTNQSYVFLVMQLLSVQLFATAIYP